MAYVLAYDIGTTSLKTCIYRLEDRIEFLAGTTHAYNLYIGESGEAEQDPEEWWTAMCAATREVLEKSGVNPADIDGLSFCSQMQGLVLVDENGNALRRGFSYMDQRATEEIKKGIAYGLQIAGGNIFKVLKSLRINNAVSTSVKDPIWKYKWVEAHEPDIYSKIKWWLDVKEYFIGRCTDKFIMTEDSAFGTLLYDTRSGHEGWSKELCKMYGVDIKHLPPIIKSTDLVGGLTEKAAKDLGLVPGIKVFGGGGDASLIGVGAGCTSVGETHIYSGTSGWVSTVVEKQEVDVTAMIASVTGAVSGRYNYFAEMETAGKCLEWVKNHLALDEIDIYLEKKDIVEASDPEKAYVSLYDYMTDVIREVPPGANGVIFTPWLHGNRCPFEDPYAKGMFFNISIDTGKRDMLRAVIEGVCYHLRWMLECQDNKVQTSHVIRFVGGGALSDVSCQVLADITGRPIEVVENPQDVGDMGAAAICAVGLGLVDSMDKVRNWIKVDKVYKPDPMNKKIYDKGFKVFKELYNANKNNFRKLNK